ncbi:MAG: hypothetical protein J0H40_17315 [Rhizobiales bacterium]|nr:hypothetical protein [Hyphomicrobiales bacterium]
MANELVKNPVVAEAERRTRFAEARRRYEQTSAAMASRAAVKVDEKMLADDEVVVEHLYEQRRAEKEASRREDLERIARGEHVDNGFFSVLDRSRARLVARRRRVDIPDSD